MSRATRVAVVAGCAVAAAAVVSRNRRNGQYRCPNRKNRPGPRQLRGARAGLGHVRVAHRDGAPQRVFRFWTGEDTDASVVVDEQGMLYVGSEWEKHRPRAADFGQMMKLDPHRAGNPLVWSQKDEAPTSRACGGRRASPATW